MEEPFGFLESEFEPALTTIGQAPATGNVVQISDSLRSQAALRERERRFRGLLDALPAAVYTTDAAGRITYYNDTAAALWGIGRRSAPANGAGRGSFTGPTERQWLTTNAPWLSR